MTEHGSSVISDRISHRNPGGAAREIPARCPAHPVTASPNAVTIPKPATASERAGVASEPLLADAVASNMHHAHVVHADRDWDSDISLARWRAEA